MNRLKSIFVSSYMMAIMGIAGYAGWMLYQDEDLMAWGGVLLTVAPILTVIMRAMMMKDMARTSAHFPLINLLGVAGAAMAGFVWATTGAEGLAALLGAVGWVTFLLYSYWFSTYDDRQPSMKLVIGSRLPTSPCAMWRADWSTRHNSPTSPRSSSSIAATGVPSARHRSKS